ncbi:MAG: T9SS C-terminal target domain-containing protein [Candidatus Zixiibacteriota bacterium]|nr:MAG: T9SS C-terminal target domain-containing protein [candidate division Zixibacteria bacterium]
MRKMFLAYLVLMLVASTALAQIDINLTPDDPVTLPPQGGMVMIGVELTNTSSDPVTFDAWVEAFTPFGTPYTLVFPVPITVPGNFTIEATLRVRLVPPAPAGEYQVIANVGDYPGTIMDADTVTVIKQGTDGQAGEGQLVFGELVGNFSQSPAVHAMAKAYPNPFNPSTVISYTLPEAAQVNLAVFDLAGRLVATLDEGQREAGSYQAVFDAANLPSGTYLYRLQAGSTTVSGKMLLLK